MIFTSLPANYAPVSEGLVYTVDLEQKRESVEVQVLNSVTGEVQGVCRFSDTDRIEIDIAPFVDRMFNPRPLLESIGIHPAEGRVAKVCIAIDDVRSPARLYSLFICDGLPRIVSGVRDCRTISIGECDELPLYAPQGGMATMNIWSAGKVLHEIKLPLAAIEEVQLLMLDTTILPPETDFIEVYFDGRLREEYISWRVVPRPAQRNRLSWLTSFGSIESYTFPARQEVLHKTVKERFHACSGHIARTVSDCHTVTFVSDPEPHAMMSALDELLSSRAVWSIEKWSVIPIDVVSSEWRHEGNGKPDTISVEVRAANGEVAL